ncbi:MAG: DUF308 domain-containing protein [Microbacterium sp.]
MSGTSIVKTATNGIRTALGVAGVLTLIAGILILVWPGQTAAVVTGILRSTRSLRAPRVRRPRNLSPRAAAGWARIGYIVLGVVHRGRHCRLGNLKTTKLLLGVFVAAMVGIAWIIEGIVSLSTLGDASSKVWTVIFAIISIIAGVYLLFSPLWGAVVLWWLLGIMLIVMGIVNIVRASRSARRNTRDAIADARSFGRGRLSLRADAGAHSPANELTSPTRRVLSSGIGSTAARATSAANSETL